MCGGMAALMMVVLMGPRWNRFSETGVARKMERQSAIVQVKLYTIMCTLYLREKCSIRRVRARRVVSKMEYSEYMFDVNA